MGYIMANKVTGKVYLALSKSDAGGNMGYSLTYNYSCDKDDPQETIESSNVEFSGPGNWDDYSEGDDYPFNEMLVPVLLDMLKNTQVNS